MPDLNVFRLNGVPYSWQSTAHFFQFLPYKGILAAEFEESRERKIVHGAQQDGRPLGITAGIYKVESVVFRLLRESAHLLMQDLTLLGAGSYGDASFTYGLQLFEPVASIPPQLPSTSIITGCAITRVKETQEVGVDELVTEFTCTASHVVRTLSGNPTPLQLFSLVRGLLP